MKAITDEIREFLEGMRNGGTIETFTNGYCYWMAVILKERFGGEIMYNAVDNHFGVLLGGDGAEIGVDAGGFGLLRFLILVKFCL